MNKNEHSTTPVSPEPESPASSGRVPTRERMTVIQGKIFKGLLIVVSIAVFVTIYVLANRKSVAASESGVSTPAMNGRSLEVEVLDASGSMRVAQHMTEMLRTLGYDVVELKRNNGGIEERTFIFDHAGNLEAAKKLATILGIPEDKVFQKIDRNLYLDLTVVVGKDYSRLKAFQSSNERNRH